MLNEVRLIFTEEFRRTTRGKLYIIFTLAVPVLLLLLLGLIPAIRAIADRGEDEEPKPIGIVVLSNDLASTPSQWPGFLSFNSRQAGIDALVEDTVREVFVVPLDYLGAGEVEWLHGKGGAFSGFAPGPRDSSVNAVKAYLRTALVAERITPELLSRAVAGVGFERVRIGEDGLPVEEDIDAALGTFIVSFVFAVLLAFSIMLGSAGLAQAVAEEKENRMIEVLLTSVKPLSIMAGKVLAIGSAVLITIAVWVGSVVVIAPRITDVIPDAPDLPMNPEVLLWVLAFFLSGYFVSAVIMAGLSSLASKAQEATQLAFLVIIPLMVSIQITPLIISDPDSVLARVLSFVALTAPTTMMIRLAAEGSSTLESLASLAVLILTGMALLWVSARMFRAGLLMYGQRIGVRRIVSALREAG